MKITGFAKSTVRRYLKRWIAALRSGRYRQTTGTLVTGPNHRSAYCCLGVGGRVCGVRNRAMGDVSILVNAPDELPPSVRRAGALLGLTPADQSKLTTMNDVQRCSFEQIADYIEYTILPRYA